jgi:hypothetical protein
VGWGGVGWGGVGWGGVGWGGVGWGGVGWGGVGWGGVEGGQSEVGLRYVGGGGWVWVEGCKRGMWFNLVVVASGEGGGGGGGEEGGTFADSKGPRRRDDSLAQFELAALQCNLSYTLYPWNCWQALWSKPHELTCTFFARMKPKCFFSHEFFARAE